MEFIKSISNFKTWIEKNKMKSNSEKMIIFSYVGYAGIILPVDGN